MTKEQYIIGIDLGTTNCTVAYTQLTDSEDPAEISQLPLQQISSLGSQEAHSSLPSFLYFPTSEECKNGGASVSWDEGRDYAVGVYARERGGEMPNRMISSAKSWLSHSGVNRRDPILPTGAEEDEQQMSPLQASAAYLQHIRECWEQEMPDAPFSDQKVLVTVPASFDPDARQLVQEAAQLAKYPEVTLLEEPQAAFYSWLHGSAEEWRKQLKVGDQVLVVDIGGGTTDFSLISAKDEDGDLSLERVAVGSHLLLGGDNMDLALAYKAKAKLEEDGKDISDHQFQSLIHACRKAKEELLSEEAPEVHEITLLGRGRSLVKSSLKVELTQADSRQFLMDGFVPLVGPEERSALQGRAGITQVGLPYAQDPRISCQLAKFLSMTGEQESARMDDFVVPSAILFNGGTMKASALRGRILELLNQWASQLDREPVRVLDRADYDFSVSKGAVCYGLACSGKAVRIKGGTSRSYFVGIEDAMPAVPGMPTPLKGVCIAPLGMEEGTEQELDGQEFSLVVGEQATFRFFSCSSPKLSNGKAAEVGTEVRNWASELSELHPIETCLPKEDSEGAIVKVHLRSRVTELGILELWCHAGDGRKWKLEFDVRSEEAVDELATVN